MWITELRYIHGSRENPEAIEVEWRFGDGTTAAATVNVNLFLCRVWKHTCKDGAEHRFGVDERLRILKFLRGERQKIRDQSGEDIRCMDGERAPYLRGFLLPRRRGGRRDGKPFSQLRTSDVQQPGLRPMRRTLRYAERRLRQEPLDLRNIR